MANIFLESNDTFTQSSTNTGDTIFGSTGSETVVLQGNPDGTLLDGNVEEVQVAGNAADTTLQVNAQGQLELTSGGTVYATFTGGLNAPVDLKFEDGNVTLTQTGANSFTVEDPADDTDSATIDTNTSQTGGAVTLGTDDSTAGSGGSGGTGQTFTLTESANTVAEGDMVTYTVTADSAVTADTTLTVSVSGSDLNGAATAASATDYTLSDASVTFANGAAVGSTQTFTVTANTDDVAENFEGFQVSLLDDSFATVASETTGITNVDAPAQPQSFTLTANADTFTGDAQDDTFSGVAGTIDGDNLSAGAGDDTLNLTVTVADDDNAAFTATGIENINLRATGGAGTVDLDFGDVTGVEDLTFRRLADNIQVDNVTDLDTNLKIENTANTASNVTVNFDAAQVTGTADTSNLTVENTTAGADFTINGVETIAVTAVGSDNDIDIIGDDLETVTIAGAGDISIDVDASVTTFDASANTGGVTMVATAAADVTATGGTGADTFSMDDTLTDADTLDGGDGTDTLVVEGAAGAAIPAGASISNVETLRVETAAGGAGVATTLDASVVSFETITHDVSNAADTFAITDYTDETINLVESDNDVLDLIDVSFADATGTADALTLNITNNDAATAFTVDDINSTGGGIETLNLVLNQGADIADASDITVDDISSTHDTVNISGDADATLGEDAGLTSETVNASTATGDLTINLGAANQTVTAGSGADTIAFDGNLTSNDTVDGGDGDDTLTATMAAGTAAATLSNIETLTLVASTPGAVFRGSNTTGVSVVNLTDLTDEAFTLNSLAAEVQTIRIGSDDLGSADADNITIDYAAGASSAHTVFIGELDDDDDEVTFDNLTITDNTGALTLHADVETDGDDNHLTSNVTANDASALTILTDQDLILEGAGAGAGDLSATQADSFVVTTQGGDLTVDGATNVSDAEDIDITVTNDSESIVFTGAMTASDATTLDVVANGNFDQTGDFVSDADIVVNLTATDQGDIRYNGVLDVDHASTINASAVDGGVITLDDIELLGVDADGDDITSEINVSATGTDSGDNGSTVTISAIDTAAATLDTLNVTGDSDSTVSITTGAANLTITEIDASAMTGEFTLDASTIGAAIDVTLGSGTNTIVTELDQADTITFAASAGTDQLNVLDDTTAADVVDNFQAGANGDVLSVDVSELKDGIQNFGSTDMSDLFTVSLGTDADGDITGGDVTAATNILTLTNTFANVGAMADAIALDDGGVPGALADNDDLLVLWTDGADTYLSSVNLADADGAAGAAADGEENLVQLTGVSVADLTADNFAFV